MNDDTRKLLALTLEMFENGIYDLYGTCRYCSKGKEYLHECTGDCVAGVFIRAATNLLEDWP